MEALEKIEKDIKKPLLRSDKKNMATLMAEFDKINAKYAHIYILHLNNVFSVANLLACSPPEDLDSSGWLVEYLVTKLFPPWMALRWQLLTDTSRGF
jgi:hypothetical protein